jgi:hypothetical protein
VTVRLPKDSQVVIAWPKGDYRPCLAVYTNEKWFEINAKNQIAPIKEVVDWISIDDARQASHSQNEPENPPLKVKDHEAYAILNNERQVFAVVFDQDTADLVLEKAFNGREDLYSHPFHIAMSFGFNPTPAPVKVRDLEQESIWILCFYGISKPVKYCYVRARGFLGAVKKTHELGINPGGEVEGSDMGSRFFDPVPDLYMNRLLSPDELADSLFCQNTIK